jgi:hypothetical protein
MFPLYHFEEHRFFSARTGREYLLAVKLPANYAASEKRYPVIYLLDGDTLFGLANSAMPYLNFTGMPESIVVGVGFGALDLCEFLKLRELHFRNRDSRHLARKLFWEFPFSIPGGILAVCRIHLPRRSR